jgi:hypothetical protein
MSAVDFNTANLSGKLLKQKTFLHKSLTVTFSITRILEEFFDLKSLSIAN